MTWEYWDSALGNGSRDDPFDHRQSMGQSLWNVVIRGTITWRLNWAVAAGIVTLCPGRLVPSGTWRVLEGFL